MLPAYVQSYIGLPFQVHGRDRSGTDCYGLLVLWFIERYGIALPLYTEGYRTTEDKEAISAMVRRAQEAGAWTEITMTAACEGDAILFRMWGVPMHMGVVVEPPFFLHVHERINTCLERWDAAKWCHRIAGFFRHATRGEHMKQGETRSCGLTA